MMRPKRRRTNVAKAHHRPSPLIATSDRKGASGRVAAAAAERPLSVQLGDPRGDARQRAKRAGSGHPTTPGGSGPIRPKSAAKGPKAEASRFRSRLGSDTQARPTRQCPPDGYDVSWVRVS